MGVNRRNRRKMQQALRTKPQFVEKVVKDHNKKAKEQREGDAKFEKQVVGTIALIIGVTLIVRFLL